MPMPGYESRFHACMVIPKNVLGIHKPLVAGFRTMRKDPRKFFGSCCWRTVGEAISTFFATVFHRSICDKDAELPGFPLSVATRAVSNPHVFRRCFHSFFTGINSLIFINLVKNAYLTLRHSHPYNRYLPL